MERSFYIISLRYAPGNWQHMQSFAGRLLQQGCPVRFLISSDFRWMNETHTDITEYSPASNSVTGMLWDALAFLWSGGVWYRKIFQNSPPSGLLLVMWHPLNYFLLRLVKRLYPDLPIIIWLHEPYKDEKRQYRLKAIVICLIEWLQTLYLRYTDVVILHSQRALRLFESYYPEFNGLKRMIPLQFQDNCFGEPTARRYVSFLGRADRAKGIEIFFALIEKMAQDNLEGEFLIVTASNINSYLETLSSAARQRLRVINKPKISDQDLRETAANSLAVLALYKETMQSGVIPVALMKGTPVIGTNIEGITEWIRDGETGVIVSANPSLAEIKEAITYIQTHFKEMSERCRAHYLATFDDRNWEREYGWFLELLPARSGHRVNSRGVDNGCR